MQAVVQNTYMNKHVEKLELAQLLALSCHVGRNSQLCLVHPAVASGSINFH